jgi:hypothetical protein
MNLTTTAPKAEALVAVRMYVSAAALPKVGDAQLARRRHTPEDLRTLSHCARAAMDGNFY